MNELKKILINTLFIIDKSMLSCYRKMKLNIIKSKKIMSKYDGNKPLAFTIIKDEIDLKNVFVKSIKKAIFTDIKIEELNFSPRSYNALKKANIHTFRNLIFAKLKYFNSIENLGTRSKDEIINKINDVIYVYNVKKYRAKEIEKLVDDFIENNNSNIFYNSQLFKNILLNNLNDDEIKSLYNLNINDLLKNNYEWIEYLEGFIIYLISTSYNHHLSLLEINNEFIDNNFIIKNLDIFLENMISNKKLKKIDNNYFIAYPSIIEKLIENQNNQEKIIVTQRLLGNTLEEVGKKLNLTRERVRQIVSRYLENTNDCWEDRFSSIFSKYNFELDSFMKILKMPKMSYYYLSNKYNKGINPIFTIHTDSSISKYIRENALNYCKTIGIFEDNKFILKNKSNIVDYLIEKECNHEIQIEKFYKKYNDFIKVKNINISNNYNLRTFENKISAKRNILWKLGKNFRYFDFDKIDVNEFLKDLNISNFANKEIAAKILLDTNPEITEKYGINDEYELHNFLKKIVEFEDINFGIKVDFLRMPMIGIGNYNRNQQIQELMFSEAPIKDHDLAELYSSLYGVKPQNVMANYFDCIKQYLSDGYFRIDYSEFTENEFNIMKNAMTKNIYNLDTVINLYSQNFPTGDRKKINIYNLNKLNYKITGNCIYKSIFSSLESAMRSYFPNEANTVTLDDEIMQMYSHSTFSLVRESLTTTYKWIQFDKNKYINFNILDKNGITIDDINDFCVQANRIAKGNFFTYKYLLSKGFEHKIIDLGFDSYFYESLLKNNNKISYRQLGNNTLFKYSNTKMSITFGDLLFDILCEVLTIDIYDLMELLSNNYGIIMEKNNIVSHIKSTTLYYKDTWEKVYIDYDKYFEEV